MSIAGCQDAGTPISALLVVLHADMVADLAADVNADLAATLVLAYFMAIFLIFPVSRSATYMPISQPNSGEVK